jgi:hypothetical protein
MNDTILKLCGLLDTAGHNFHYRFLTADRLEGFYDSPMADPLPRVNEKRGPVSGETLKDRRELAERLAGCEEKIRILKPILRIRFAPHPLKKALIQYLTGVGLRQGGNVIPRLSVRHVDGLIELFTRWCPIETELALWSHPHLAPPPALQNPPPPFPGSLAPGVPLPPAVAPNPNDGLPSFDLTPDDESIWDAFEEKEFTYTG